MRAQTNQGLSREIGTTFLLRKESGGQRQPIDFTGSHAGWRNDAQTIEKDRLSGIGPGDTAQSDLAMSCGWQDDIVRLDTGQFFENGARGIAEARAVLPHLERLPEHEGEKTNQNMRLNAIGALMPDGADVELIFLDPKCGLRLS
jgi:hypothetical protein